MLQYPGYWRPIRRGERPVEHPHRCRRCGDGSLSDHGGRHPFRHQPAALRGLGEVSRQMVSHQPLPMRRCRFYRQARRRRRHRRQRGAGDPGDRSASKAADGFPADSELLPAGAHGKVDPERVAARKADYDAIIERTRNSFAGFELARIPKSALEATPKEREREFERMWDIGGFIFGLGNYQDVLLSREANKIVADYLGNKIRRVVKDPAVAEKLVPKKHPFGTKRTPLDTNYYETFNKDSVLLIDADIDGPFEEITKKGIRAGGKEYEFDIIVFATGFDAFTGSLKALNIKGRGGRSLNDAWADGPRTYLGLTVAGFPNLFTITGPQSPSVLANMPVAIEQHVEWIADCIAYMRECGLTTLEAVPAAQDNWVVHVNEVVNGTLLPLGNSWWMGANIPGKPRAFLPYLGPEGIGGYRKRCAEIAAKGYEGFILT